jgi:hypothetical protein
MSVFTERLLFVQNQLARCVWFGRLRRTWRPRQSADWENGIVTCYLDLMTKIGFLISINVPNSAITRSRIHALVHRTGLLSGAKQT